MKLLFLPAFVVLSFVTTAQTNNVKKQFVGTWSLGAVENTNAAP